MRNSYETYRPYLILRVEAEYNGPDAKGLNAICSSDYMGAAEFEFGAVPASTIRARENLQDYVVAVIPLDKKIELDKSGEMAEAVYALMPKGWLDCPSFAETVNALVEGKTYCKEPPKFDGPFSMWRDIKNDIFFAFNETYLHLVYSILGRDLDYAQTVDKTLSVGDEITVAAVMNGVSMKHVRNMSPQPGKVVGILDRDVVVKNHNRKVTMPFAFIITQVPPAPLHILRKRESDNDSD